MFIYVIRADGGPAKIGFACDPKARREQLQIGSHFHLSLVYSLPCYGNHHRQVEKYIHDELKAFRLSGEWFDVSDKTAIKMIQKAGRRFEVKPTKPEEPQLTAINFPLLTPVQARAARAVLNLALKDASKGIGIGINTLNRFEMNGREPPGLDTAFKVARFYEGHGLEFPDEQTVRVKPQADAEMAA